ncbi:response regulator transcription factor [Flavihumibacter petaseus]|uniref:Putative two-component response regulator n=1 Tax=Flavihumibacter petaseus NBRC 106054 TaxID=1220578 RepID=A0A0E9MYU0_9BACT|nr:response regulator transcription factor [Flavihumibacter petaseus]GAO42280.1 putative two-component response regulator [Flavihumibacter petaseus NBRC 106054]
MSEISILLVEDEKKIAETLKKGLEEQQYKVTLALDGDQGRKLFDHEDFDLVIADINLPGINGYELLRHIRTVNQQVPVLMATAMGTTEDKIEGFNSGADDYIVKPFDFAELVVRIKALLKRSLNQPVVGKNIRVSDLIMNLDSKEVSRAGNPIQLTAKEFQLLEYMVKNKNRVVSRADIALNVWDIDFDTGTNVIDVYVNFLRKKIDRNHEHKLIHTQVGMGYVLKEIS